MKSTLKEIESQVHPANTKDYWNFVANKFGISQTLACAIAQPPGKSILRLEGRKKEDLIMEIHSLQGTIKDIERIVPGCNRPFIQKVIDKNSKASITEELVDYKGAGVDIKEVREMNKERKYEKRGLWIPGEVIAEAKKSDMPLYDFVSLLYESYKEETPEPKVVEKIVEVEVEKEVIKEKEVVVPQKQVQLVSIVDQIQNQDCYPDMRKLHAAFEIISGIINRTMPLDKVKEVL